MARKKARKMNADEDDDLDLEGLDLDDAEGWTGEAAPRATTPGQKTPVPDGWKDDRGELQLAKPPPQNSVEIKRGAKGVYTWTIKLYGEAGSEAMADLVDELERVDGLLRGKFVP